MPASIAEPLRLPCGAVLPNRLCKAAMTEGLADPYLRATARHQRLYRTWAEGGAGLLITGNVQIDRRVLERPGNVAIDVTDWDRVGPAGGMEALRRWAAAGTAAGNHLWMQISHAGRQSPRYVTGQPLGPSAVQLDLLGNYARPRALREDEIRDFILRFAQVAVIAREAGFTGVQIHAAHGYLISSFLSPVTNRRTDDWGGSLANRARLLLETVRATRKAVGDDFPVSVKLNSDDFRKGGFTNAECVQVVEWLNDERIDLLEISGGTYEQPRLLGVQGRDETAAPGTTAAREAYFLDYARRIRAVARMPLMVTGGFRSRAAMDEALASGDCDLIGIARPLCVEPDVPRRLLDGSLDAAPAFEARLREAHRRLRALSQRLFAFRVIGVIGEMAWFYQRIFDLADGRPVRRGQSLWAALLAYLVDEYRTAWRMRRARAELARGRPVPPPVEA